MFRASVSGCSANIADIEKGFIDGDLFHERSEVMQALHHLARDFAIEVVTRTKR